MEHGSEHESETIGARTYRTDRGTDWPFPENSVLRPSTSQFIRGVCGEKHYLFVGETNEDPSISIILNHIIIETQHSL